MFVFHSSSIEEQESLFANQRFDSIDRAHVRNLGFLKICHLAARAGNHSAIGLKHD